MKTKTLTQLLVTAFAFLQIGCKKEAPVPDFTINNNECTAPCDVSFTPTFEGKYKSFNWFFGDGATEDKEESPTHTYTEPGFYTVRLEATNNQGSNTATHQVKVLASYPAPTADFSFTVNQYAYQSYHLDLTNLSQGTDVSYVWQKRNKLSGSFSGLSLNANPSTINLDDGQYEIRLIASNFSGADTITKSVDGRPEEYGYYKILELTVNGLANSNLSSYDPNDTYPDVYATAGWSGGTGFVCTGQIDNVSFLPFVIPGNNVPRPIPSQQGMILIEVRDDDGVDIPFDDFLGSFTFVPGQVAQESNWEYLDGDYQWVIEMPLSNTSSGFSGTVKIAFLGS